MNKQLLKRQIDKNEFEFVEIDLDDEQEVKELKKHNKEINHKIYEEKKLFSHYSVEHYEMMKGQEFQDDSPNPLEKLIEEREGNFYDQREVIFQFGLSVLGQALNNLTEKQNFVIEHIFVNKQNYTSIANDLSINESTVREIYKTALKKLRKFFRNYPEIEKYYPNLFKD